MKRLALLLTLILVVGCGAGERPFVIKNDCAGSWLLVVDGRGNVLTERLEFGLVHTTELSGYRGETLYLTASGYEVGTNRNLGTAETTRYVPNSDGSLTFHPQVEPWIVNYLVPASSTGGCRH